MVLSLAAIALAGCGGGRASPPPPTAPPQTPSTAPTGGTVPAAGADRFAAQVRAVCRRANAAGAPADGDANKLAAVLDTFLPQFRAIGAPPALAPSYARLLSNLSHISAALKRRDIATVKRLEDQDHALAAKLGIRHCAA